MTVCFVFFINAQNIDENSILNNKENRINECSATFILLQKGNKQKLIKSNIFLLPEGIKQTSDNDATVRFENLKCNQEYTWVVNVTGYKRLDIKQLVSKNAKPTKVYVEKVEDGAFKSKFIYDKNTVDGSKRTVKQEDFISAVGARGDPIIALENEPGFSTFAADGGGIILQGADPEDTRFYVNGHEIPLIFHSLGFSSVFIPESIESIDLLTAGFGAEYGRTIAGNINLNTKAPDSDRVKGMAYVDLLNSAAYVQGPMSKDKRHRFSLGGRVSYIGPIFNLVTGDDSNVSFNQVPQFFDVQGSYYFQINPKLTFSLIGFAAQDKVKFKIKDAEDPTFRGDIAFKTAFFRVMPGIKYQYKNNSYFDLSMSHGLDFIDQKIDDFFFDAKLYSPTLRANWKHQWNKQFSSTVGIDHQYTKFNADLNVPAGTFPNSEDDTPEGLRDIIDKNILERYWEPGAFVRLNWRNKNETWNVSPNIRFDYSELVGKARLAPRFELSRKINSLWKLRASLGQYYQNPQAPEVENSFGNPNLTDVSSQHYALTAFFDQRETKQNAWYGDATVFYKNTNRVVVSSDDLVNRNGELVAERFSNAGKGYTIGAQTSLNYRSDKWNAALSYTLLSSRRREALAGPFVRNDGDQRHNFNVRGRYQLKKWALSSRIRFLSGLPTTPVLGGTYDLDQDVFIPLEGMKNSDSLPNTFQVDVRVDRKWVYDTWILSLYLDIQNVLNRKNGTSYDYAFDYSSREVSAGIPILPTFGIKGEF